MLDRRVMALADRGGASGLVGARWADLCAEWAGTLPGSRLPAMADNGTSLVVERVARLDDTPRIALLASRRGLQNPDLLFIGEHEGRPALQAADAKFSIETARSKQVSAEVVSNLLELGPIVQSLIGGAGDQRSLIPGVFLSPDYALTHAVLRGRFGIVRPTVRPHEVVLVETNPASFFVSLPGAVLMPVLASIDGLPIACEQSLLAGLYYFRLARAVVGSWIDSVRPLLAMNDSIALDEQAILDQARTRVAGASTALDFVQRWDADVDVIRAQRAAVDQVTALPLMTKELRELVARAMRGREVEPPSSNQVRRRIGAWFRAEIRAVAGPMPPPVVDLPSELRRLAGLSASLAVQIPSQVERIVDELLQAREGDPGVTDEAQESPSELEEQPGTKGE